MIARLEAALEAVGISIGLRGAAAFAALALAQLQPFPLTAQAAEEEEAAEEPRAAFQSVKTQNATRVAEWIATSNDNGSLPYMIIDKQAATVFLFDAEGESLGEAPVLIGIATGDEATPGVGSKDLAKLGPAEKTTPAGRFLAKYGRSVGRQKVLWIDYATSVALHAVVTGNKKERRRERLLSLDPDDNRITYGCINAPAGFYTKSIQPLFKEEGGVVYVLPDDKPLEEVFPRLRILPFLSSERS